MSTKIYDAYALPAGTDALVANLGVSETIRATYRRLALRAVGVTASLLHDDTVTHRADRVETVVRALNGFSDVTVADVNAVLHPFTVEDHRVSNLRLAAAIVQAINSGSKTHRVASIIDLQFTVSWMVDPQPNADGSHDQFAKVYTERQEYIEAFLEATGATDFHYQNSTDQPDGVTEGEWEKRRATWERVMGREAPASFSPSWGLTDVNCLEFETWTGNWLTAEAVCDELDNQDVFKPGRRERFQAWLSEKPCAPEQVGS